MRHFPADLDDLYALERLAAAHPRWLRLETLREVETEQGPQPVWCFELGDREVDPAGLPALGLFAGVHGIEQISVELVLAFLEQTLAQAPWSSTVNERLRRVRVCGIPIVNPAGYLTGRRANHRGVDLMRNAPVDSPAAVPFFGGHRLGPRLPYWRGDGALEPEAECVAEVVERRLWPAPFALALDIHSGFGRRNSLWTPWAREPGEPPGWVAYQALREAIKGALPCQRYRFEPQSRRYCTHGDLWDWLYERALKRPGAAPFLSLTLEIGTWRWIRRSPLKTLGRFGLFNPVTKRRRRRVLEGHVPLLQLLADVAADWTAVFCP